jgi:uncharacterized OB-fold protein
MGSPSATQNKEGDVPLWRSENGRVVLVGRRCKKCGKRSFSRTQYCDACRGDEFEAIDLGGSGKLYSFSEVHIAPPQFKTPYVIGYVDMADDIRVFGQVENCAADLKLDDPVEVVLGTVRLDNGEPVQSYKFRKQEKANV